MSTPQPVEHDDEFYAALSARAEAEEYVPISELRFPVSSTSETELDELIDELDPAVIASPELTPALSVVPAGDRATPEELRNLIALGRPSLDGTVGTGPSPKRQVRLPRDIDSALTARAAAEHRAISDILREAVTDYLDKKAS